MKRILSCDQSTSATGLAFFVNGKLKDYCLIKPKMSKRADELRVEEEPHLISIIMPEADYGTTLLRITAITDQLEKLIEKFKPDEIWFEEIFENANPKGFRSLARLQGFIAHIAHKHNVKYTIIEESKWITAWGKYGRGVKRPERKEDIRQKVNDYYNLDIQVDDVSDAIAIGRYAVETQI
jgi:Holliday junction resolvasome RuvABC endonuclease subunit